ncbi:hypothetical protein CRUP_030568 [Coryphaenoides rupestris]|nr:hypothetical protein CRUP_030568 [Coryphaenoides rupestris]
MDQLFNGTACLLLLLLLLGLLLGPMVGGLVRCSSAAICWYSSVKVVAEVDAAGRLVEAGWQTARRRRRRRRRRAVERRNMDKKKVVLITGCSSGIGLSLAVRLASDPQKTYKVYATMRDLSKKERLLGCVRELHRDTLDILQMDVTRHQSIRDARDRVAERRVDILVCNAGVGLMGPLELQSVDTMRQILEVNLLGTLQTIQAFLPDMKARSQGRILVTGSVGGLHGEGPRPHNAVPRGRINQGAPSTVSKFAIEGACESLAIILPHFNIHMSLIECGPVNTDFLDNQQKAELGDPALERVDAPTLDLYEKYLRHCTAMFQNAAQDTEDIVKGLPEAIQAATPALRYYTGGSLPPLVKLKTSAPEGCCFIRAIRQLIFPSTDAAEQQPP